VLLKVPKLHQQTFETAIIERYRRRESSVEEIEMYLAGVSVHRAKDIAEASWARGIALDGVRPEPIRSTGRSTHRATGRSRASIPTPV
jgi:hypothetical protein